jgi:hypothetical protein
VNWPNATRNAFNNRMRLILNILYRIIRAYLLLLVVPITQSASEEFKATDVPPQAGAAHYTIRTFSSGFSASDVDIAGGSKSGFKWYPWKFFGAPTDLGRVGINRDGSVTLSGDVTGPNGQLATVSPASTSGGFVGTAFGGGGYFEATLKFDPKDTITNNFKGWPSWWSMAIEHMVNLETRQWPGQQSGYEHFIEVDFFEYDLKDYVLNGKWNYFGAAMHDWFGLGSAGYSKITLPHDLVVRGVPRNTDFTQYHRYGFLWVPATATRNGYSEHYFDGKKVGRTVVWRQYTNQEPPPKPPWTFSIIDNNHLVLILGTGIGAPMTIMSVNVWQASVDNNMKQ